MDRSGLERVRAAGREARAVVITLSLAFTALAVNDILGGEASWFDLPGGVAVGCGVLAIWTLRVGIWVGPECVVFRSFWRTISVSRDEISLRVASYKGLWTWGSDSWFFAMLVLRTERREVPHRYTVARRSKVIAIASRLKSGAET